LRSSPHGEKEDVFNGGGQELPGKHAAGEYGSGRAGRAGQAKDVAAVAITAVGRMTQMSVPRPGLGATRPALRAAAALVVACTAGCSVVGAPDAPSGLERQVIHGERISAATRAHASRQPTGHAARPAPATAQHRVSGSQVTAIGDSVMAASAMALESVLPGIYIDAKPSRQMPAGVAIVRRLAASGRLRPVVVVGLGTNYIVTTGELNQLVRLVGPHRRLVLVNTHVPDEWSKEVNATMAGFVRRHPAVVLADWFDTIRNRTYLLWPDHVHPLQPGTSVYAHTLYRAIQATRRAPAPPSRGV